jgi:hypothetical protein
MIAYLLLLPLLNMRIIHSFSLFLRLLSGRLLLLMFLYVYQLLIDTIFAEEMTTIGKLFKW